MRDRSDPTESRFAALFDAFALAGVTAVPAVYNDDFAEEVETQLRNCRLVRIPVVRDRPVQYNLTSSLVRAEQADRSI